MVISRLSPVSFFRGVVALVLMLAFALLSGSVTGLAQTATPVQHAITGNLSSVAQTGTDVLQARFTLANCGQANPLVPGVTIPVTKIKVFTAASGTGTFSGSLWGNDQISCNLGFTTVYQVSYLRNGVPTGVTEIFRVVCTTVTVGTPCTWDLTSAEPVATLPSVNMPASGYTCPVDTPVMAGILYDWTPVCISVAQASGSTIAATTSLLVGTTSGNTGVAAQPEAVQSLLATLPGCGTAGYSYVPADDKCEEFTDNTNTGGGSSSAGPVGSIQLSGPDGTFVAAGFQTDAATHTALGNISSISSTGTYTEVYAPQAVYGTDGYDTMDVTGAFRGAATPCMPYGGNCTTSRGYNQTMYMGLPGQNVWAGQAIYCEGAPSDCVSDNYIIDDGGDPMTNAEGLWAQWNFEESQGTEQYYCNSGCTTGSTSVQEDDINFGVGRLITTGAGASDTIKSYGFPGTDPLAHVVLTSAPIKVSQFLETGGLSGFGDNITVSISSSPSHPALSGTSTSGVTVGSLVCMASTGGGYWEMQKVTAVTADSITFGHLDYAHPPNTILGIGGACGYGIANASIGPLQLWAIVGEDANGNIYYDQVAMNTPLGNFGSGVALYPVAKIESIGGTPFTLGLSPNVVPFVQGQLIQQAHGVEPHIQGFDIEVTQTTPGAFGNSDLYLGLHGWASSSIGSTNLAMTIDPSPNGAIPFASIALHGTASFIIDSLGASNGFFFNGGAPSYILAAFDNGGSIVESFQSGLYQSGAYQSANGADLQLQNFATIRMPGLLSIGGNSPRVVFTNNMWVDSEYYGTWQDFPTAGLSGIGWGGAEQNCIGCYVSVAGVYFSGTQVGDQVVSDIAGSLFLGNGQNALTSGGVPIGSTTPAGIRITANAVHLANDLYLAPRTPASPTEPCTPGQFAVDGTSLYACTAPNTWARAVLTPWTN